MSKSSGDPGPSFSARSTVAAVVVSWNRLDLLKACLQTLRNQTHPLTQLIVIDNGSADGSPEWLRQQNDVELIENAANRGFAAANNQGIELARANFVLLANSDVEIAPDYIERCLDHFNRAEVGSVTGKLLRAAPPGVIDSTGHNVYRIGWAENRGEELPDRGFDTPTEVFGVCAAAALYRSAALDAVRLEGQVFDESYFAYIEDVDLDWRLRWAGWRAWYEPEAVAIHHRSASGARFTAPVMRNIIKNRLLTVVKNYDRRSLLLYSPSVALFTLVKIADFGRLHPSALLGISDTVGELPRALRYRRRIRPRPPGPSAWLLPFPWRHRVWRRLVRISSAS